MPITVVDSRPLADDLRRWAAVTFGDRAQIGGPIPMGGHAGLNFGFDVQVDCRVAQFVIRLAPPGVVRSGNTDVLRQVPLLEALSMADLPVVPVFWSTNEEHWFGTDAMIQRRLNAKSIDMFRDEPATPSVIASHRDAFQNACRSLAELHAFNWQRYLSQWSKPLENSQIFENCRRILAKSPEPDWALSGTQLMQQLANTQPPTGPPVLMHGDFQTNNVLFNPAGGVEAIVDWELADLGPAELDVGWLAMMADPACWHADLASRLRVQADPYEVFSWYGAAESDRLWWHFALACLRYGSISVYNIRLHRTGRRVDTFNESLSTTVPVLFDRGLRVLEQIA